MPPSTPTRHVFWLFGLSGAGKSTLASALVTDLRAHQVPVLALDGDELRRGVCQGLGFTDADRAENLRRAAEIAKLGTASGLCVVAAFITPLEKHRQLVAGILGPGGRSFIHLSAPLEVCRTRDPKGLYTGAREGKVTRMTGVSSGFEEPSQADLVISTATEAIAASSARLAQFARARLGLTRD